MNKILVADDEDSLRRNLTFILNNSGYIAKSARNTADAIAQLKREKFDVVLTDLVMPDVGGGELIKFIYSNYPDIYIIIMTAYPSIDSAINAVKKGVIDYFTKPFKTHEILEAINKALKHKNGMQFKWDKLKPFNVTARELSILQAIVEGGLSGTAEIADKFSIKPTTVKQHLENLYGKFNVRNRTSLVSAVVNILRK